MYEIELLEERVKDIKESTHNSISQARNEIESCKSKLRMIRSDPNRTHAQIEKEALRLNELIKEKETYIKQLETESLMTEAEYTEWIDRIKTEAELFKNIIYKKYIRSATRTEKLQIADDYMSIKAYTDNLIEVLQQDVYRGGYIIQGNKNNVLYKEYQHIPIYTKKFIYSLLCSNRT